ncbi:MAG: FAD-dependent oxidoreductase [Anaerolineae bacterium]|jgi:NADH-quinone oxidoreductase subunit F|nr:FAD-dependent oxidoreductase [Anaerolineae bacterium]MDH7474510.1 FAD-dependent oxidoreductase [Anaerolineae bacterium]
MAEALYRANVLVCGGTGCTASGSVKTFEALQSEIARRGLENEVRLIHTGCRGFCEQGPVMVVYPEGIFYCRVHAEDIPHLVEETLVKGRVVEALTYKEPETHQAIPHYREIPFYTKQQRIVLSNCGLIDPENIEEYIARGGYEALSKALFQMTPEQVIDEVKRSGLRGRGGAGFLTGLKWEFTYRAPGDVKYVVCNADEGDPGAFMDRSVIEGDPHSLLEGMIIAAYAIGAKEGYIYCRAEYPLAIKRLKIAIAQAEEYGLLGDHILGTDFSFHLKIKEGAGAFVCGEETALLASIEGRRGEPRPRPPFPAVKGLWGKPTNINNVKSYANVPRIIAKGAEWFASIGMPRSPGTAIFALTGKVNNTGLIEVPMGITLGEIIFDIGGGIPNGKRFKAVQTGGPLGGCLSAQDLNLRVDFDSLKDAGAVMGSGGMIVVDEDTCMVEFSKFFLTFATAESCGKCVPCRVGGKRMLEVLTRITEGKGRLEDIETIKQIAAGMDAGALCALGQLTPGPMLAALRYFENEFIEHIVDKKCKAGVCKALVRARCTNACPAEVDVPSYVSLVAQGRYAEALEIHRRHNPFALVCGRVCPAFCESRCRRGDIDEPIAIRSIKRFMADHEIEKPWTPPVYEPAKTEKVAVIGAGPAGLTAALRLAQKGYKVTVFEKLPVPGGMMAVGIPEYRLPRDILNIEIENIKRAGVEIKCNQALGKDFTIDSLMDKDGYKAVVLAIGAHQSRKLGIEGEDLAGVYHGVDFLRDIALGNPPDMTGKRVVVVGGGNVAIDAARSAWRLGASEVHVVYRRTRQDMPAHEEEIEAAEKEGIIFSYLTNPVRVIGENGKMTGVEVQNQLLGDFDRTGRRRPVPEEGSNFVIEADMLVPAIGQGIDLSWTDGSGVEANRDTTLVVNDALATTRPGVFAAGDAVSGPATVIQAVAQGNRVAVEVDYYLRTGKVEKIPVVPGYEVVEQQFNLEDYAEAKRPQMPELPVAERRGNFREVELGMDEDTIREECKRCLRCDLEWLESEGLAFEPVPDHLLVEDRVE